MSAMRAKLLFLILLYLGSHLMAQKSLELTSVGIFGRLNIVRIPNYSVFEYKAKGENKYRNNKIVNLQDTVIVFEDGNNIFLREIKRVKLRSDNRLIAVFSTLFIMGGVAFITVNTINNLIVPTEPVVNEQALLISAGLVGAGVILKQTGIKRVKINERNSLRIINIDFGNLNSK